MWFVYRTASIMLSARASDTINQARGMCVPCAFRMNVCLLDNIHPCSATNNNALLPMRQFFHRVFAHVMMTCPMNEAV